MLGDQVATAEVASGATTSSAGTVGAVVSAGLVVVKLKFVAAEMFPAASTATTEPVYAVEGASEVTVAEVVVTSCAVPSTVTR